VPLLGITTYYIRGLISGIKQSEKKKQNNIVKKMITKETGSIISRKWKKGSQFISIHQKA
jgi:hypothetical protein